MRKSAQELSRAGLSDAEVAALGWRVYRGYRAIVIKSGIERPESVDWHCLRHIAATQWIKHGAVILTVSRRRGRAMAAPAMNVYGHLLKGQQHVAAQALDHLIAL